MFYLICFVRDIPLNHIRILFTLKEHHMFKLIIIILSVWIGKLMPDQH